MGKSNKSQSFTRDRGPRRYIDKKSSHSKSRNRQRDLERAIRNGDVEAIEEFDEFEDDCY